VLWIDGHGKSKVTNADGATIPAVTALLKAGFAVGSIDLLLTGGFTADGQPVKESPRVNNPRSSPDIPLATTIPCSLKECTTF
jgi:hypothetical protein